MRGLLLTLISCFSATVVAGPQTAAVVNLSPGELSATTRSTLQRDSVVAKVELNESSTIEEGLSSALPAQQDDYIANGNQLLEQAAASYSKFKLDDALKHLKAVDDAVGDHPEDRQARKILARRYLLSGVVHFDQDKKPLAERDFRVAHRLDRQMLTLDTAKYRPAVVTLYQRAVAKNRNAGKTPLKLNVTPKTATVRLDGHSVRNNTAVGTGPHLAWFVQTGFESHSKVVEITESSNELSHTMTAYEDSKRLLEMRQRVAESPQDPELLAQLAKLAGVNILVVVRPGASGVEASVFHVKEKQPTAWVAPGTRVFQASLAPPDVRKIQFGGNDDGPSWYQTWWGGTMMVTVGVAAVSATIYFLATSGTESDEVMIGRWCPADC